MITEPALSIDLLSQELENISNAKHAWGLSCEIKAAQFYLKKDYKFLAHRLKTPFAEIDLVFYREPKIFVDEFDKSTSQGVLQEESCEANLILVEVKSYSVDWAEQALSVSQKQRLQRARFYLQEKFGQPTQLHLVVIEREKPPVVFKDLS